MPSTAEIQLFAPYFLVIEEQTRTANARLTAIDSPEAKLTEREREVIATLLMASIHVHSWIAMRTDCPLSGTAEIRHSLTLKGLVTRFAGPDGHYICFTADAITRLLVPAPPLSA